ncbi:MAG: tetratricopeptide repeat protein [Bradyrhizobium sp.]|uniref:tetratricopeptide repeat protein n=1 Tax=Bradyrhizobium sp. TaxID=376 RepID=UPI0025BFE24C|nr:tetratricopeptide repeat protein [Bradyrhizobium sp.]MBI5263403.1 tetratricopeptide repeat protein [Bradyrhizobium sp.]
MTHLLRLVRYKFRFQVAASLVVAALVSGCGSPEDRAQSHYESGMALIAKKDDLNARLELLKAVKYKSDKVEVWRALAGIDERTKANSLFLDLRRIVELDPNDLGARLKLARIMLAGGAAEAALKVVDAANEGDKPSAALHALRAMILLRTRDTGGAVREAQRALEIDPGNVDAVTLLASRKLSDRDVDAALKLLDSLPKDVATTEVRVPLLKAEIFARKGDLPKSEQIIRTLVSEHPQEPSYQTQLLRILIAQRKLDDAEKEIRKKVEAAKGSKAVLELVGFLNSFRGADAARAELEARIKAGGDVFDYQIARAELDTVQNRTAEARQVLQKLATEAASPERQVAAKLKLAQLELGKGDRQSAETLISEILSKDRRNGGALRLRAALSVDKGQTDSAIADLREALNDQPKSPELLLMLALAYERADKNELADRQYADALKWSNLNPEVALRYVAFLQRRKNAARAEDVLTEVANRNSNNLQVLSSLAQVRLSRQNWPGALAVADALPPSKEARVLAGEIRAAALEGQNKFDESIAALEEAHRAVPEAAQPVIALASAYVRRGRADQATALLQDMNKRYPGNARLLVLLGQTELAQKKDEAALADFKEAISRQPKDPVGYSALSEYYIRNKNFDAAEKVVQAALKEIPGSLGFRLSLASLQILKGNNEGAIAEYEAILKEQPQSLVAANNLVSLILDHRSDKESLEKAFSLSEALKDSNLPQFQDTLGWARYKQGDLKGAISALETAAAKASNLSAVHYHLGMTYAAAGQAEKAALELKKAFDLEPEGTPLKESIRAAMKSKG